MARAGGCGSTANSPDSTHFQTFLTLNEQSKVREDKSKRPIRLPVVGNKTHSKRQPTSGGLALVERGVDLQENTEGRPKE